MPRKLWSVVGKEFLHIRRDPRSLVIIFLMPILQILLFGYAIDMDVKNLKLGIYDQSRTAESRALIQKFTGSGYFISTQYLDHRAQIEDLFRRRKVKAVLVIPTDYARSFQLNPFTPVQILVDGSDSNTGSIVLNTARQIVAEVSFANLGLNKPFFEIKSSVWYNPEQKSSHFIVPGLIAVLMMMICALLTSITITRERETGTLEQILVAPVKPVELIFGKVLPYVIIASLAASSILLIGRIGFGVPFLGSPLLLAFFSLLYLITSLSIGILISTIARTQQVSMMLAAMTTMLPSVILSGFIFPLASLPPFLQAVSHIIPARYYLEIIRGILLKGNGFTELWQNAAFLLGLSACLIIISIRRFRIRLE
ncbi:MAG: ABC transporter permease [bacterium]